MQTHFKKIIKKLNTYQMYTILFIILCFIIFFAFIKNNRTFIWKTDGFKQHYLILENFYNTIKNGNGSISGFSWNLGLGLDKIGQLSYYLLGDPFAYISLLFPYSKLKLAYSILVILRIFCVGLAFIAYSNYHKKEKYATLVGALLYTFSGFIIASAIRHPFFTNAAIWLPLMFLGIDKILKEDKYKLFTIVSAISAISNYYFFYMITILTFIYAIVKYFNEYYKDHGLKTFFAKFFKTLLCYIIGVLSAGILLLPTIYALANNSRLIDVGFTYYNLDYYAKLIFMSEKTPFWVRIFVCPLVLTILPISILNFKKNKENRTFLINLIIQTIILLIPFLGSVMNGFSFQSNRWTFAYTFVLSYLVTLNIRKDLIYSPREFKLVKRFYIIYFLLWYILREHVGIFPITTIAFGFLYLLILVSRSLDYPEIKKEQQFRYAENLKTPESNIIKNRVKYVLLATICLNIVLFSWQVIYHSKYYKAFLKEDKVDSRYGNLINQLPHFDEAVKYIQENDNSTYRIATNVSESNNESFKYNYLGLNTYLSVGNKYISNLSKELLILNIAKTNPLREFDSRTRILTLMGNKYYVVSKDKANYVPYGYTLIKEIKDQESDDDTACIYENQNYLPICVFYNNYTSKEEYNKLSALEKEQALLKTAVIENKDLVNNYNIKSDSSILNNLQKNNVNYELNDSHGLVSNNTITTTKKYKSIKLNISDDINTKNCELYLYFENLKFNGTKEYSITAKYNGVTKEQVVKDKVTSPYYIETPNILFNLGYSEQHSGSIKILFSLKGTYTFDNIKLIAVPMDNYSNDISNLKKYEFKLESFNDNNLTGSINNSEDGILQVSTSYTSGWKAYVDGVETKTINVNTGFIGIPLTSGKHKIELKYETPYLQLGTKLSIVGVILIILVFIIDIIRSIIERRKKKNAR